MGSSRATAAGKGSAGPLYKQIGRRIREERERLGMSQEKVAQQLGVSIQAYSRYELGQHKITLPNLLVVAQYLGIPIDHLIAGKDPPARPSRTPEEILQELQVAIRGQTPRSGKPTPEAVRDALLGEMRNEAETQQLLERLQTKLGRSPTLNELVRLTRLGLRAHAGSEELFGE